MKLPSFWRWAWFDRRNLVVFGRNDVCPGPLNVPSTSCIVSLCAICGTCISCRKCDVVLVHSPKKWSEKSRQLQIRRNTHHFTIAHSKLNRWPQFFSSTKTNRVPFTFIATLSIFIFEFSNKIIGNHRTQLASMISAQFILVLRHLFRPMNDEKRDFCEFFPGLTILIDFPSSLKQIKRDCRKLCACQVCERMTFVVCWTWLVRRQTSELRACRWQCWIAAAKASRRFSCF